MNVVPSLVRYVSEFSLATINQLVRTLLERHSIVWLTKSKVGLAIMTMLLSRAEILKQGDASVERELPAWYVTRLLTSGN